MIDRHFKRSDVDKKGGTLLKMIFVIVDNKLINICLYDSVCYKYGLLMYNLLLSLLIFHCDFSISLLFM